MTLRKLLPTWYKYPTEARAETTHLQAWETEMGKKTAKAATPAGKGGGRGGAGRGQGRKAKGATPAAKPAGHDPSDTRVQQTLAGLLGARADQVANPKRPAVYAADVLKWNVKDAKAKSRRSSRSGVRRAGVGAMRARSGAPSRWQRC